jgi:hypothetical protein
VIVTASFCCTISTHAGFASFSAGAERGEGGEYENRGNHRATHLPGE